MENKNPLKSKTLWSALIVAASAFLPPVQEFISKNPEMYAMILGGLFAGLRVISKGKISVE
jgi:hypothetical protein